MGFAELKAATDGRSKVVETEYRGMIKAGKRGSLESLIASAGGAGGNFPASIQRTNRTRDLYRTLRNWVWASTNVIGKRCGGQHWLAGHYANRKEKEKRYYDKRLIPQAVLRRKGYSAAEVEPDPEHDVIYVLDKPNSAQHRFEFIYMTVMNILITGEWYWVGGVSESGKIVVYAVPSAWMVPDHREGFFGGYLMQTGYGEGIPIPKENVARGYLPDPSDIKACLSPLSTCLSAVKIDEHILASQLSMFEAGINPRLIITIGDKVGPDGKPVQGTRPTLSGSQRRQIERAVHHLWSNNQGIGILDGLVKDVHKFQLTAQEMDWKQSGDVVRNRIYQAFGTNPYVTGEIVASSKAQAVVAESGFITNVINPLLENISCSAADFFTTFYEDGEELALWLEPAVAKDEEREDRQWTQARQAGDVTQNEVRSRLGLEDVEQPPERSPIFNNPQVLAQITTLAAQVSAGAIPHDEAVQILVTTLQISKADATKMIPDDPPEPTPEELAAQALAQGGQPGPTGAPGQPPAAGNGQKPPAKPGAKPKPKPKPEEEPEKAFDPSQPRNPDGTWGSGGGSSGSMGESPASDEAAAVLDRYATPSTGSRTGEYEKARAEGEAWVKGEANPGWQALYDETQERLSAAGVTELESFRGIEVASDHPLAKAISEGKIDTGHEFEAGGMALASWSEDGKVATRFADSPLARAERRSGTRETIGIVLRRVVPAADVVTGARVHAGFLDGEKELVLRNTGKARVELVGIYR